MLWPARNWRRQKRHVHLRFLFPVILSYPPQHDRIASRGEHHGQKPTANRTHTGLKVRQSSEEDAEAEGWTEEADRQGEMTQHPAWLLVVVGLSIAGIGIVWLLAPSIPWLGKLPGDISIERESFKFYLPVVTCIVISLLLTGIMWLIRFFSR